MVFTYTGPFSGNFRYKRGKTNPRILEAAADTVLRVGMLVCRNPADRRYIIPAADLPWTTDAATTRAAFIADFCGVCMQSKEAGAAKKIRVATTGIFIFDATLTAALNPGDMVTPLANGTTNLLNESVVNTATAAQAIGRAYEYYAVSAPEVQVEIKGRVFWGPLA